MNNKIITTIILLLLIIISSMAFVFRTKIYANYVFHTPIPDLSTNVIIKKQGDFCYIEFHLSKNYINNYKEILKKHGYIQWESHNYNINDKTSVLDCMRIAGFSIGNSGYAESSMLCIGKKYIHVVYDYPSEKFIAYKDY